MSSAAAAAAALDASNDETDDLLSDSRAQEDEIINLRDGMKVRDAFFFK